MQLMFFSYFRSPNQGRTAIYKSEYLSRNDLVIIHENFLMNSRRLNILFYFNLIMLVISAREHIRQRLDETRGKLVVQQCMGFT